MTNRGLMRYWYWKFSEHRRVHYIVILSFLSWRTPQETAEQIWAKAGGTAHPLQLPPSPHYYNLSSLARQRTAGVFGYLPQRGDGVRGQYASWGKMYTVTVFYQQRVICHCCQIAKTQLPIPTLIRFLLCWLADHLFKVAGNFVLDLAKLVVL